MLLILSSSSSRSAFSCSKKPFQRIATSNSRLPGWGNLGGASRSLQGVEREREVEWGSGVDGDRVTGDRVIVRVVIG